METLRFTLPEVLSLIGVFQCLYVIVYICFRAKSIKYVILPVLYFISLGAAFSIDFASGYISELMPNYAVIGWGAWLFGLPLSVLLIIQMSQISKTPSFFNWMILSVVPIAYFASVLISQNIEGECLINTLCPQLTEWLYVTGIIAGALSLLVIWTRRNIFSDILNQKAGKERYWLILSLIIVNIAFLGLMGIALTGLYEQEASFLRTVLGLGFVYLVSTSLFRIYPSALQLSYKRVGKNGLSEQDERTIDKIEGLLKLEKIYHEPTYSRSDLARELEIADSSVSRLINIHYKKSFPQLLNEYRVADSKRLLLETAAPIKVVAEEVGFNSLPSFNRVFKDIAGQTPSSYRNNTIK